MGWNNVPPNGFPQIPDIEDLEAVVKDVTNLKTTTAEQGAEITDLNSTKANKTDIATEFSDLTNYNVGDLVYYEGALYEFQVDHTAGAWETSEVIQKDLSDIITTLKSGLIKVFEVDYSDFTWDEDNKTFYCTPNGAPQSNRIVGSSVMATNGIAIMGLYINSLGVYYVTGFLAKTMQPIGDDYTFKCMVYYI